MNGRPKFRAWDGKHIQPVAEVRQDFAELLHPNGEVTYAPTDFMVTLANGNLLTADKNGDLGLMQYTGLKDKNGVEIYEGDIVLWPNQGEYSFTAVVKWDHHQYYMDMITWKDVASFDDQNGPELEVIGNIYEHPHLITIDN